MNLKELEKELRKNPKYVEYENGTRGKWDKFWWDIEDWFELTVMKIKIWLSKIS
jgi:hypothetical protein